MSSRQLTPEQLGPRLAEMFRVLGPLYRTAAARVAADEHVEGVSTGVRAVLEVLAVEGHHQAVPDIARRIATSRQYVQRMTNEALAAGLVASRPNPSHRQSRIVDLTDRGADVIDRIRRREQGVLGQAPGDLSAEDIDTCIRVLRATLQVLKDPG